MWDKSIRALSQAPFPLYCRSFWRKVLTRCWAWSLQTRQHPRGGWEIQLKTDCQHFPLSYSFCNQYFASKYHACFHLSQEQTAQDSCDHFQFARITWAGRVIQNGMRTRHATLIWKRNRTGADSPFLLVSLWLHFQFTSLPPLSCYIFNRLSAQILSCGPTKKVCRKWIWRGVLVKLCRCGELMKAVEHSCVGWTGEAATVPKLQSQKWDAVISSKKTFSLHTWDQNKIGSSTAFCGN